VGACPPAYLKTEREPDHRFYMSVIFGKLLDVRSLKHKLPEIRKSVVMSVANLVASSVSTEYLDTVKANANGTFRVQGRPVSHREYV